MAATVALTRSSLLNGYKEWHLFCWVSFIHSRQVKGFVLFALLLLSPSVPKSPYRISACSCACSRVSWPSRRRRSCGRRRGRAAAAAPHSRADRWPPRQTRTPATARGPRKGCHLDAALLSPSWGERSGRRGRGCAAGQTRWWPGMDIIYDPKMKLDCSISRMELVQYLYKYY